MARSLKILAVVMVLVVIGVMVYSGVATQQQSPPSEETSGVQPDITGQGSVPGLENIAPGSQGQIRDVPFIYGNELAPGAIPGADGQFGGGFNPGMGLPPQSKPGIELGPNPSFPLNLPQSPGGGFPIPGGDRTGQPPAGIPLPSSGLKLPSLKDSVPGLDNEQTRMRLILPPIIGDDLLSTIVGEQKFTLVYADKIDNSKSEGITKLHGNVRVQYKDNIVRSQEAIINKEDDWARFFGDGGVEAENEDGKLKCDEIETHFDTKIAYLKGPVDIIRYANTEAELEPLPKDATRREKVERALKKKETHITCTDGEYDWGKKITDLHNGVRVEQDDKYLECEDLHFEREADTGLFKDNVILHQDNGDWLFKEKVITNEDKKVTQVVAREKTTAYCDELEFIGENDWMQMRGSVHGVQPDKEGKCKTLTMDDSEDVHLLTLDEYVWLHQNNGDWLFKAEVIKEDESDKVKEDARKWATLTCDKLDVHTDTEDAKAVGSVYMEQEHQNGKADSADYIRKQDLIHLVGNVEVQREEKNTVFAEEAFLFMTTRIFEARGNVRSTAWVDVEEEQKKRDEEKKKAESGGG